MIQTEASLLVSALGLGAAVWHQLCHFLTFSCSFTADFVSGLTLIHLQHLLHLEIHPTLFLPLLISLRQFSISLFYFFFFQETNTESKQKTVVPGSTKSKPGRICVLERTWGPTQMLLLILSPDAHIHRHIPLGNDKEQPEEIDFRHTKCSILPPKEWIRWKRKCQIPNKPCMYTCDFVHTALWTHRRQKADEKLNSIRKPGYLHYCMLMMAHEPEYKPGLCENREDQ